MNWDKYNPHLVASYDIQPRNGLFSEEKIKET